MKMLHKMRLNNKPFSAIIDGKKTIELRLNDEKRQKVCVGDFIEFKNINAPGRLVTVRVTALHRYDSFEELFKVLPKEKCGFRADEEIPADHMDSYYSPEKQKEYGALGIEFRLTELQRFIDAQNYGFSFGETYAAAFQEMKNGYKASCWMWYVFPQIKGLGSSSKTVYFSISDLAEAKDYYAHPVLGSRLREITSMLLDIDSDDPVNVFGIPDAYKLRSCMTLFKTAAPEDKLFQQVLDKFCGGKDDGRTLSILGRQGRNKNNENS